MVRNIWKLASWPILGLGLASPWLTNCAATQAAMKQANELSGGKLGAKCPDLNADALAKYDFVQNFKIQADAAAKLQAGAIAAVEIKGFADGVDADLKVACGGLAKDLGSTAPYKDGTEACKVAAKAIGDFKGKLGAKVGIAVVMKPPVCRADMNVAADCAAKCDVKASGGKAKVECERGKLSGECSGQCSGSCDVKAAAKCDGTCTGKCDAAIKGKCSGKCDGKCDGKDSKGVACSGVCDGKCDANVEAECSGKCEGSCKLNASATCDGTCTGECKGEFKAPKCTGEVKPPEVSAECKGRCDAQVQAHAECTPAQFGVAITGAADAKAAEQFKAALEKNMPAILKVAIGIGDKGAKLAANVKSVVEGVQASVQTIAQTSGSAAQAGMIGGQITACFGEAFQGALGAAGSLQANVNVSLEVKASASGSAGGSAGGKTSQ
jgi:hypothetical protein